MPGPTAKSLERLHRLLVASLRQRGAAALDRPFTIAEIYQDLVPYRRHRDDLGVDMNGDYEHLLLRLLAGEGDYVRLESEPALRAIRKELEQSNPNTGVYREYAAADVRLSIRDVPELDDDAPSGPDDEAPRGGDTRGDTVPDRAGPAPTSGLDACRWCDGELPDRPGLRFCPHCGRDVLEVPCPSCGEPLEADWRYCIKCGLDVASA